MTNSNSTTDIAQVVKSICALCPWFCGIDVHVAEGKVVKVEGTRENPYNQGYICVKAEHAIEYEYSPERLKYPQKRSNGKWWRISWDEALDTIAAKLAKIKQKHGPDAVSVFIGDPVGTRRDTGGNLLWRFFDLYGTPSRQYVAMFCSAAQRRAQQITYGDSFYAQPDKAKSIIVWGMNPTTSFPVVAQRILEGLEKGAKLIVIDPRRTDFAKRADLHLQPRPGTDTALALGMLHTIITEELYDKEFVSKWTIGFDKLIEHVKSYPPEKVAEITGVAAERIKEAARVHATNRPGCVVQSVGALDKHASGFQNSRAICILEAVIGNVDVMGSMVRPAYFPVNTYRLPKGMEVPKPLGAEEYPLFYETWGQKMDFVQTTNWAEMVLDGRLPTKAMLVIGANPALTWPNSQKFKKAVRRFDFIAVMDVFMTETAEMAHMVLPAATFLERHDLRFYHPRRYPTPYVIVTKPAVAPLGECWDDAKFCIELAKRMGYGEYFPWKNVEEAIDYFLTPSGLTLKYLTEEKPAGVAFGQILYNEYEKSGFPTPSKKIELYSETMAKFGYDSLPVHREPPESPLSTPKLAKKYPLILTTAARIAEYWHSEYRMLPKLRERAPEPLAEIHPDTAVKYNVSDGDMMIVETKRGKIQIKARVTEDIAPDVVSIPQGWRQANVNLLTDETPASPETGYPSLGALLCRVTKKG